MLVWQEKETLDNMASRASKENVNIIVELTNYYMQTVGTLDADDDFGDDGLPCFKILVNGNLLYKDLTYSDAEDVLMTIDRFLDVLMESEVTEN